MGKKAVEKESDFDHNVDRYPDFLGAMRTIVEQAEIPDGPIERIEITFLASGEATYRVWRARAVEPDGGYLPA
jgi:hypothetical protein